MTNELRATMTNELREKHERFVREAVEVIDTVSVEFAKKRITPGTEDGLVAMHAFAHAARALDQQVHEGLRTLLGGDPSLN